MTVDKMLNQISESDDYKRGWYDGYTAAKQHDLRNPQPFVPSPVVKPKFQCGKCNKMWEGFEGYLCPRQDCVVQPKVTWNDSEWQKEHDRSKY